VTDLRALIDEYNDAWNRQDLDAIAGRPVVKDDVVSVHRGDRVEGADAVRAHIGGIFERNPTLRFTGRAMRVGGDFVVSEWTARTTSDGETREWDGIDVFPIVDGKIARKDVYSSSHAARTL
jgi:uncharacterized protein (TIGR02246 family)